MNSPINFELLRKSLAACSERIDSLAYSVNKNRQLFPLDIDKIRALTDEQKESIDALVLRYNQCVSMIQEQIFRGIALVEQEDLSDMSNRDKSLLMEKLGVIESADEFGVAALLRNKFSHNYPEESKERIEKLNLLIEEVEFVIGTFKHIVVYATRKNFLQ